jgi:drug/metabolite transporter (DMT)-like permease
VLTALDTGAHVLFKLAAIAAAPLQPSLAWVERALASGWVYGAIVCYVGTFFTWIGLLRRAPIGAAFAVSHLDVVAVLVASALLLNERISSVQIAGASLIVGGIACLALSESREPRAG